MASDTITEAPEPVAAAAEDMEVENPTAASNPGEANGKRERDADEEANGGIAKKQKPEDEEEKSVEEERMEKAEEERESSGDGDGEEKKKEEEKSGPVSLGPKTFASSVEMFDYFYKLLHHWPTNVTFNKYESMVLLELIKQGHPEPEKKIGPGVKAIEIRYHPTWKSRCFFIKRDDQSVEDFSFRKCVDHILPLPENMKIKSDVNRALGGGGKKGGGGGRGGGRGRGGWGRGGKNRR